MPPTGASPHVAAIIVRQSLDAIRKNRIRVPRAHLTAIERSAAAGRVSWDEFASLSDAVEAACKGDPARYHRFAASFSENAHELRFIGGVLVDPGSLFRVAFAL